MPTTRTEVRKPSKYVLSAPVPKVYYGETTLTAHKPMKVKVAAEGKLIESEGCIDCWYALFERFWERTTSSNTFRREESLVRGSSVTGTRGTEPTGDPTTEWTKSISSQVQKKKDLHQRLCGLLWDARRPVSQRLGSQDVQRKYNYNYIARCL